MFQLLQLLELSKSFSSYLCILHSNKTVSSNIWLRSFFDSWKTFYTPNKAACWKMLLPIYPSFWFLDWLHDFLSITILVAWCSSIKTSGPSNHEFPFLSHWRRLAGSITSLLHIYARFIFLSMCCQLPVSVNSKLNKKDRPLLVGEGLLVKIKEAIIRIRLTGDVIFQKMVISIDNDVVVVPWRIIGVKGFWNQ